MPYVVIYINIYTNKHQIRHKKYAADFGNETESNGC